MRGLAQRNFWDEEGGDERDQDHREARDEDRMKRVREAVTDARSQDGRQVGELRRVEDRAGGRRVPRRLEFP